MRIIYLFLLLFLFHFSKAQSITVSGQCISSTITLSPLADQVDGKIAYQGTGTVDGVAGVTVSIYWIEDPGVWVLDFDGQPYFQSTCNFAEPPSSSNSSCPYTAVTETTCTGANPLTIAGNGVLAVRLTSLSATELNGQVQLNWKTASESDNKVFEVMRSADGNSWLQIGSIPGYGQSTTERAYRFTDKTPMNGKNFYKLLQKDANGHSSYSAIVSVDLKNGKTFQVFGSAASGRYQFMVNTPQPSEISLQDMSGKKIWSMKATKGIHRIDLSNYPKGIYLLKAATRNDSFTQKLINP